MKRSRQYVQWHTQALKVDGQRSFVDRDLRFNPHHDKEGKFTTALGGTISAAATYADLPSRGQKAVDRTMKKYGVTNEALEAEIESQLSPKNIEAGRKWYRDAKHFNSSMAEEYGATIEQVTALTSCLSPRTPWPRNKYLVEQVLSRQDDYPSLSASATADKIGGTFRANLIPAVKIARGASIDKTLSGVKRRSFFNNMLRPGATNDVTVDTWMLDAAQRVSTKQGKFDESQWQTFLYGSEVSTQGGAGYVAISDAVRRVAEKHDLAPSEVQAAYWVGVTGSADGLWGRND